MERIEINLLGTPELLANGEPIAKLRSSKAVVLLAYVFLENRPISRERLAFLFWPDATQSDAKTELRRVLHSISTQLPHALDSTRLMVAPSEMVTDVDVWQFEQLAQSGEVAAWEQAVQLVRGNLLAEMTVADSAEISTWLLSVREQHQLLHSQLRKNLIEHYRHNGQYDAALTHAKVRLALDDWLEEAHADLMWLYAALGQRSAAHAQYEKCKNALAAHLGIEPMASTQALYAEIMSAENEPAAQHPELPAPRSAEQTILLQKVQRFWIDGMLHEAIGDGKLLTLPYIVAADAVAHPWQKIVGVQHPISDAAQTVASEYWASDRALLIMGEPGAGKTIALLTLTQALLIEANQDEIRPIPVLFNLSSWAAQKVEIADWIVAELVLRYQIPSKFGRRWLANNALMLLLDGLDEMPASDQALCVEAINQFRAEHGLTGLVVCCRTTDYLAANVQLQLGRAIQIEPLASEVIDDYLEAFVSAELQQTIQKDDALIDLAKSPLMLNILRVISAADGGEWLKKNEQGYSRSALLQSYVGKMFQRRNQDGPYSAEKTEHYLQQLARGMHQHNQSTFLIEQLQPSWLEKRLSRAVYLLLTRSVAGVFAAVIAGMFFVFGRAIDDVPFSIFDDIAAQLPASIPNAFAAVVLLVGTFHGFLLGIFDLLFFERLRNKFAGQSPSQQSHMTHVVAFAIFSFLIGFAPFALLDTRFFAAFGSFLATLVFCLLLLTRRTGAGYRHEIRAFEAISWSWRGALRGLLVGVPIALVFNFLPYGLSSFRILGLIPSLLGGVQHNRIEQTKQPNQGLLIAARNALLVSLPYGLVMGWLFKGDREVISLGLSVLNFVLLVWAFFGGLDLIKHAILRLLLYFDGVAPLPYATFLNYATSRALLRRVGGSYLFIHRLLLEHFVSAESPPTTSKES